MVRFWTFVFPVVSLAVSFRLDLLLQTEHRETGYEARARKIATAVRQCG